VDDVSIRMERGEIYGLLGRMAAASPRSSGSSAVFSPSMKAGRGLRPRPCSRRDAVKRLINRVSVDAAFFKKLSPAENLSFAARLYGLDAGKARREAVRILARLGIGEKRMNRPSNR